MNRIFHSNGDLSHQWECDTELLGHKNRLVILFRQSKMSKMSIIRTITYPAVRVRNVPLAQNTGQAQWEEDGSTRV
jgi:hypothetical protein